METKSRKMKFTDLKDMLNQTGEVYGDRPAYIFKTEEKGKFRTITHKEFRENINALGTTLIQMGLKDKRIALISENRYEWELSYLAVASGVGVIVPLDKALPDNELESLILRSQVEAIIYSSKYDVIMNTLREKKNTNLKYFISMDLEENTQGIYAEKALVEKGKKLLTDGNKTYIDAKIDSEKMGIMLFTSGTTAMSKAVMLSHKNLVTNVMDIIQRFDLTDEDRFLSFLPLHHVFECTVGFLYPISIGGSIAFCEGVKHMAENIKEFEITAMISVPAVFDIIYRKVMKTIEKKGKLANLEKGKKVSQFLLKMKIDLRKQLFKEVHESLGPKLKLVVTGGAALDPETEKGFNDLGFDVEQGYGLTETAPVIAAETPKCKEYYAKLKELDMYIGRIIRAVEEAGILKETIFIITADHGGINKGHGGKTMQEMQTPFIISGKNVKKGMEFHESMMQYDVASTIAYIFGLQQPQVWIGRPMTQVFK